jgi:peptidoglycan/xylan/chitin deacetylase (PgdA/CDA1 family)
LTDCGDFILTFHRVRPEGQKLDAFDTCPSISAAVFRQTLEYVKSRYAIVPLKDLAERPSKTAARAAVTFDDGWRDNYDVAYPILRELGVPATIFVVTGKIASTECFWQQKLGNLFRRAADGSADKLERELRSEFSIDAREPLNGEAYRCAVNRVKRMPMGEPGAILDRIVLNGQAPSKEARIFLNEAEIHEMSEGGVDFGSHTVNHRILTRQPRTVIDRELSESRSHLERLLGKPVDTIAYPNGDANGEVIDSAKNNGYRLGCTTLRGTIKSDCDSWAMPRLEPPWDVDFEHEAFSGSALEWLRR